MSSLWIRYSTAFVSCVLFFIHHLVYSQTVSDTLQLDEIEVVATRIQQPLQLQPTHIEVIDSARISLLNSLSVAEVLASQSSLHIKEYGPGGMATASQRGLSAEQVQVLWEGIPINSSTLGQTDISLLPASLFSNIQVSSGAPSTAFGGGSLSGAIYLGSSWRGDSYVSMSQLVGSFGQWQSSVQGQYKSDGWLVSIRGLYDYAENDYEYFNRAYNEVERRQHNRAKRYNLMATLGKSYTNSRFKSTFWISDSDNHIPGNILSSSSQARQIDKSVRWLSTYQHRWKDTELEFKNYLGRGALNYFDPETDTQSFTTTRRWLVSSNIKHALNDNVILKGELSGELTGVETNNYNSLKRRQQFSALTNPEITLLNQRLHLYPALRLDVYNDFGSVLSPSLGINYELLTNRLYVRGQLSRDFNPPTFNALYWGQGGDPDLKAEYSRGGEVGLTLKPSLPVRSSLQLTAFYNDVENGIRWYPEAAGVYTPANISQMVGKGIEAAMTNNFQLGYNWNFQLEQSGSFNRTEITEPRSPGDAGVGKQVRYVPQWKYSSSLNLNKGPATILLQYQWVSRRYVTDTEDIDSSLDPYGVVDIRLQLQKRIEGITFKARVGVNNILSEDYEIIQWYAMPQRNYNFSITATYQF